MSRKRLGTAAVTAQAHRKNARAIRAVAHAQRRRAETLREVVAALLAEAELAVGERPAIALRKRAQFAESVLHVVEVEANTLDREAERAEAQAAAAQARAQFGRRP